MRKILTTLAKGASATLLLASLSLSAEAQNIQFHYDLGRTLYPDAQAGRPYITATVEQKSLDKWGDTFYFVDMNFLSQGAVQANWKFMRSLRFWKAPFSWHVRYDGGMRFVNANAPAPVGNMAISLKDAFFTGATYHYRTEDGKLMLNWTLTYKYIKKHTSPHNWEATVVWNYNPTASGVFKATGFATLWREKDARPTYGTTYKFMSQPQFWCNLDKIRGFNKDVRLSLGTELRISKNVDAPQWLVIPTLALRWSFGK